jgi:glycosyltransferase involved in cell wall biosynthesis
LKVIIVAQNASTQFGGESFLPLQYFEFLRRRSIQVWLVSHERNRADLSDYLGDAISQVSFIPDTRWHIGLSRIGDKLPERGFRQLIDFLMGLLDAHFQKGVIRHLMKENVIDVIHQPIPVSPRVPSFIHGFGVPVVIGPMNGNMCFPPGYRDYESGWSRRIVGILRSFTAVANWIIPGKRRAAALVVANGRTRDALPVKRHRRVIELGENGVDGRLWVRQSRPEPADGRFRLVFLGRLVRWKAVDLTIEAVARARQNVPGLTLDVIGTGPEMDRLIALSASCGLSDCVTFHGFQWQAESARLMADCDALILNSLFESGGAVVLEAMSLGLAVIASDWGGPAEYLDPESGILVSPVPRDGFVARLAEAIEKLAVAPGLARRMGEAGSLRVRRDFSWDAKIDRMIEVYREVIAESVRR